MNASRSQEVYPSDPGRTLQANAGKIDERDQIRLKQLLLDGIESDFDRFLGRYLSMPKDGFQEKAAAEEAELPHGEFYRALGSRWMYIKRDNQLLLYVNGHEWELPLELDQLLEKLCSHSGPFTLELLAVEGYNPREVNTLLSDLFCNELLVLQKEWEQND